MTLSQRTILIIVSTFIALLFVLATTSDIILLSSFSALEKNDIASHSRHISNQFDDKLKQLSLSAQEIAEPLNGAGARLMSSARVPGLLPTEHFLRAHRLDIAAVYDAAGRAISIRGFDCEKNRSCPVADGQRKALDSIVSRFISNGMAAQQGVVNLDGSPLMSAFVEIKDRTGIKRGIVATGWYIDRVEIEQILRESGAAIEVSDLNGSLAPDVEKAAWELDQGAAAYTGVVDATTVAGYFILKDVFGQPSFIVRAAEGRLLYEHGKATIAYIVTALLLAGGVLGGVMLAFVRGTILTRLQTLTSKVQQITETHDISVRVPLSKHQDELQTLTASINSMLDALERAEAVIRDSEERYRMLFERAPDAIMIIGVEDDEAGRVIAANEAAAEQHGYSVDELVGFSIYDLNTPETNKTAKKHIAQIAAGEWINTELWHKKKDGTSFPIEVHAGLIRIGGKKYILGFDRDITQRKITEQTDQMHLEQIRQLNERLSRKAIDLAAANNELETFNYSVSHDMRGPLTRISGYCQLLLDDDVALEPRVKEYITRIYESELWLNEMIDALLHLAQLTRAELVSSRVNLSDVAHEIINDLSLEYPGRSVRAIIEPGVVVAGDSRLLKMVMGNLLGNAWKYSAEKSETLIEFGVTRAETGPVYFVRDNGAGFDMKHLGKLFRVFTRLHDSSQFEGTGIGLATVQRIIFRHGGRVWAEAEPGIGATFFFTLP